MIVIRAIRKIIRECILLKKFRRKNQNLDFTIISQNCIGGVIYADLGLPFNTPTINMFIEDENFVKMVENFEHYMKIKPIPKTECFIDPIDNSIKYPKIMIDDIEICCIHYKSCEKAIEAWERRKKRINYNNIYVMANSWNLHDDEELIRRLCNVQYKTIIFTEKDFDETKCFKLPGEIWYKDERGIVRPNITDFIPYSCWRHFETFFDFVAWLN